MGIFNFFKKDKHKSRTSDNGVLGPTFFDGLTEQIIEPANLDTYEWRRKLISSSGQKKFRIKFFGELHNAFRNLIVGTNEMPALVVAVDITTGQEIVIYDGCRHGYNAMFCDKFSREQIEGRHANTSYKDSKGNDTFELVISAYYGTDYDDEFSDEVDENGLIELIDGTKVEFEIAKRNGFDTLQIFGTALNGDIVEIVSEELA